MGDQNTQRVVNRAADGALIIKDTFHTPAGTIEKQKLVMLYPDRFSWTSTHLSGPNKHSQFLYTITPRGNGVSILDFTALHLEYDKKADTEQLAERLCRDDAAAWKLLAEAMEKEHGLKRKSDC